MLLMMLMVKILLEHSMKKKSHQEEFRIEKVINKWKQAICQMERI